MSEKMLCPRRSEAPFRLAGDTSDDDARPDGTCFYCGSLLADVAMAYLEQGVEIEPTDKSYKAYIKAPDRRFAKFYYQHLSTEQKLRFIELLNERKLNIAHPGHFYVPPFFIRFRPKVPE